MRDLVKNITSVIRYNAFHVFSGKFIYFLALALILFLTVIVIYSLDEEAPPGAAAVYYFLLVPGVLLTFYPAAYCLQNDTDSRMMETLFGIPDYRFKVWLVRNLVQHLVVASLIFVLTLFCRYLLAEFEILPMLAQVMFPILFIGSLGFMMATLTKSGNGTAVVMVVFIMFFWIAAAGMEGSRWNLFHNPYTMVEDMMVPIWQETTFYNRVYIIFGTITALLMALLRLQNRERFI